MGKQKFYLIFIFLICLFYNCKLVLAQNDVMMQGFNFYVPVDIENRNGTWWDNLANKSQDIKEAGFTGIWTPPPSKGLTGIEDAGYSVYDHFDLGNYNQRGTTETRYGSRAELDNMIRAMHERGIEVYSDTILHHITTDYRSLEVNPVVKAYVASEANGGAHIAYPTNLIVWRLPNAAPGDYYFQVKGYNVPCFAPSSERSYEIYATWTNPNPAFPFEPDIKQTRPYQFESEPNNSNGQFNGFPKSGGRLWANMGECGDVDEYKITVSRQADVNIILSSMEGGHFKGFGDQTRGYRISRVSGSQGDLTNSLQTLTYTNIDYQKHNGVTHTGAGEQNWIWDYTYFHPNNPSDYLETYNSTHGVIPRAKFFGHDIDTGDERPDGGANRMKYWGKWLANQVGFDGYRLDSVNLFEEDFAASWINSMPRKPDGSQRFVVAEYASPFQTTIRAWVEGLRSRGADVKVFDFNLRNELNRMANGNSASFNMTTLNHAGFVRDNKGGNLPGTNVVTFVDSHDTSRPNYWVYKDWQLPYAYTLFAEGRPSVLYANFYGTRLYSENAELYTPTSVQQDLRKLINIRRQYLEGEMVVLSETGNPEPASDTANVYAARRGGNLAKNRPGGILVLNNHETEAKCLTVDNAPNDSNYENWSNKTLVDLTGAQIAVQVSTNGRVKVCAAPRGYSIYVPVEWMNNRASDFNRDGAADLAVWRPSNGFWYTSQNSNFVAKQWGAAGDRMVAGDYDGDRKTDFAVWRSGTGNWHITQSSNNAEIHFQYGMNGDVPVPADYDGDGKIDMAVFRPASGNWHFHNSADNSDKIFNWGLNTDLPVPSDYDGDGRADIAVWRPSNGTWYVVNTGISGVTFKQFGQAGDKPVPADYDGDRKTDLAVFRPSNGNWFILKSKDGAFYAKDFGTAEDKPAPSDFDADGKADIAVWRPSNGYWFAIRSSNDSFFSSQFGQSSDTIVRSGSIPE
jgi:alpha-amylase